MGTDRFGFRFRFDRFAFDFEIDRSKSQLKLNRNRNRIESKSTSARVLKYKCTWYLERLCPVVELFHGDRALSIGEWQELRNGDVFSLQRPPTPFTFRVEIGDDESWVDPEAKDWPSKYPQRIAKGHFIESVEDT